MKIAVISHAHFAIKQPFKGGLESHTFNLVHELQRIGHDVTTFAKFGSDASLNVSPTFFGNAHGGNSSVYDLSFKITMKRLALSQYDLIINNSLNHIPIKQHSIDMPPMITILHTPPLPHNIEVLKRQLPQSNHTFIAVSEITARQWRKTCGIHVVVVANGIDVSQWHDMPKPKISSPLTAVWTGRITPEKGTHIAIEACQHVGARLIIAGGAHDRNYFSKIIKPLLKDSNITYHGALDQKGVDALYAQADVALVTPIWDEPFGLVAIEALAAGVPVAALPNGALPDIIDRHVGSLASNDSPAALAKAMRRAAALDSSQCRSYVKTHFTLQEMVAGYMKHADALLSPATREVQWQNSL